MTPNPHTNLTTSSDGFKADLDLNGATVRIKNRHEMFCEVHYSTYYRKLKKKKVKGQRSKKKKSEKIVLENQIKSNKCGLLVCIAI